MAEESELPLEEYHRATHEITRGNAEAYKPLFSRRDEVILANPFGPPARGWSNVSETLDRASQRFRDGELVGFENLTIEVPDEHANDVGVEQRSHPGLALLKVGIQSRVLKGCRRLGS